MLKTLHAYSLLIILSIGMAGCSEESSPQFKADNFTSIFDSEKFHAIYTPIDMKQTPDGGYLVLGSRKLDEGSIYTDDEPVFSGIFMLKVDQYGNLVKELELEETSVHPVPALMTVGEKFYFFCMDAATLQAQLAEVDANLEGVTLKPVGGGLTYPAAASLSDNNFLLLGYNNADKNTVLSLVSADGNTLDTKGFFIGEGEDVENPIIHHYFRTGRHYPFDVGKVSNGLYYFNGFYNFTFSLVFANFNDDEEPVGVVQGQQADGGFSAVTFLGGNKFATSIFNYGDNYFLPNIDLTRTGNSTGTDLIAQGYSLPELVPNSRVKILRITVNDKNVLIYGCDTKSKQIGLLFYDEATGTFMSSRYLGFSNPFEIANLIQTADGGLAVCGTTYIAGRFPRVCIFKLSKEKLSENIK